MVRGGQCEVDSGMLSPAYWALGLTKFFALFREAWQINFTRNDDGWMDISAHTAFTASGVLSMVFSSTWQTVVERRVLHESLLFLGRFFRAVDEDMTAYHAHVHTPIPIPTPSLTPAPDSAAID